MAKAKHVKYIKRRINITRRNTHQNNESNGIDENRGSYMQDIFVIVFWTIIDCLILAGICITLGTLIASWTDMSSEVCELYCSQSTLVHFHQPSGRIIPIKTGPHLRTLCNLCERFRKPAIR